MTILKSDTWALGIGWWVEFRLLHLHFGPYVIYFTKYKNLP
jgi:hypothetical protein